jgi:hypothetical protein
MFVIKNNRRIAQTLRNSKCFYEKSKSNRFRCKACAHRSWYAAIENTWSDRCVEKACFVRVAQLQAFFWNSQMNETAFMLQRTFNRISLALELEDNQAAVNVVKKLKSVQTFDEIIVDTMNLNKTYFVLLFLNYMIVHSHFNDMHRLILIFVFSEMMLCQWMNAIKNHFLDLKLIIAHEKKSKSRNAKSWISFLIMKIVFQKLIHWFQKFMNIFDINDNIIIIIDHTRFDVDFSRLMREHLCKIFLREKLLKERKTSFYASSERSHWACYSTYYVLILLYLWLFFLLS